MLKVQIANRQGTVRFSPTLWRRLLRSAAPASWGRARLSIAVVGNKEMCALNRRFTGRSGDTDVLAFALDEGGPKRAGRNAGAPPVAGEIIVCASRAAYEARMRGVAAKDELTLYVIHGLLHLLGYDDHSPGDRKMMYAAEEQYLRAAGVSSVRCCPPLMKSRSSRKRRK